MAHYNSGQTAQLQILLNEVPFNRFIALKEIQLEGISAWPYTEYVTQRVCPSTDISIMFCREEVRASHWPKYVDALIRKYNIVITDSNGIPWRPRAQRRQRSNGT